jgi:putative hemolysin
MLTAVVVLMVLLLLNGVFAMSELALMTSRPSRLAERARRGDRGAAAAIRLAEHPTRFLSTVQIGITLIGILAGAYGEKAISGHVRAWVARSPVLEPYSDLIALTVVVLGITYFSLVMGELVPKRLALAFPERMSSLIAPALLVLSRLAVLPAMMLTWSTEMVLRVLRVRPTAGDDVSEEDVASLVNRAASLGVLTKQEHALVRRTMRTDDLCASDLMTPRQDIVGLKAGMDAAEVRERVVGSPHNQFPVYGESMDDVVGFVSVKTLIARGYLGGNGGTPQLLNRIASKPLFVPETCRALLLLERFREADRPVAIVVDEYGGTSGLVTVTDVVRSIVGDLSRADVMARPRAVRREDGSWLIDGRMPVEEAARTVGIDPDAAEGAPEARTVAGLVVTLLGRIPTPSESVRWAGWRFEVVDMDGTRVDQVLAMPEAALDAGAAE